MKLWKEFKEFAFKGNVIDLAVGVIIGSAFTAIVNSVVNDLFTPLLSLITGRVDFSTLAITLGAGENAAKIAYGSFLQAVFNFLMIAICIFAFVKAINKLYRKGEAEKEAKPAPRLCPYCFGEIDEKATRCPHCTSELRERTLDAGPRERALPLPNGSARDRRDGPGGVPKAAARPIFEQKPFLLRKRSVSCASNYSQKTGFCASPTSLLHGRDGLGWLGL